MRVDSPAGEFPGNIGGTLVALGLRKSMRFMRNLEPLALLAARVVLALVFIYHGYPKLVHPTEAMREFFVSHGFPGFFLSIAGILEFFGGLLLIAGLFTRPAALLLTIEMGVAIWKVHSSHGIMAVKEYEFPLTLAAICFVLATAGAGRLSLDQFIFEKGGRKIRRAKQ
jgi:putative oxidoreductase